MDFNQVTFCTGFDLSFFFRLSGYTYEGNLVYVNKVAR